LGHPNTKNPTEMAYNVTIAGNTLPAATITEALNMISELGALILTEDRETAEQHLKKTGEVRYVCGPGIVAILQAAAVAELTAAAAEVFRSKGKPALEQMALSPEQAAPLLEMVKRLELRNSYGHYGTPGGMYNYSFPAERPGYLFNLVEDGGHAWLQGTCHGGSLQRPLIQDAR
jgi:hypothetical protein